jgi:hypothetical protein
MPGALFILQAGAASVLGSPPSAQPPVSTLPTIELRARVRADRLRIEREGEARLTVEADPLLAKAIDVRRSKPVPNAVTVRDVEVTLDATATIDPDGGPAAVAARVSSDPGEPQP